MYTDVHLLVCTVAVVSINQTIKSKIPVGVPLAYFFWSVTSHFLPSVGIHPA